MNRQPGAIGVAAQRSPAGHAGGPGPQADHLDHLVINVMFAMDSAAAIFSSLGFRLTARGHHSLGSINHLMMVPGCYLELVGLPLGTDQLRQEVLDSPIGASGFVGASDDIEAKRQRLLNDGFEPLAIKDFSRPVLIEGVEHVARFRTVGVAAGSITAGRAYWCQHLTPELVWRDDWLVHDNSFAAIEHLVVQSAHAALTAQRLARATGSYALQHDIEWHVVLADGFRLVIRPGVRDRFAGIGLAFRDLSLLASRAMGRDDVGLTARGPHQTVLTVPSLDLELQCRQVTA